MTARHATIWSILGIGATTDQTAIRRAYSARLKRIDPEVDPAAFIALREAHDHAMAMARSGATEATATIAPPVERRTAAPQNVAAPDTPADQEPAPAPAAAREPVAPPDIVADTARIDHLTALVLAAESRATAEEIGAAAEAVLADPAMISIDHATRVELVLAQLVRRGTPRSDPIIEPATAYFRWDADHLNPSPLLEWILKRREDRVFEAALPHQSPRYAMVLEGLRKPVPARSSALMTWWDGVRVEYLLAHLHAFHPTIYDALDPDTVRWWQDKIQAHHQTRLPIRWLRSWRRDNAWNRGIDSASSDADAGLYFGIVMFPFLWVWFLLRRQHSMGERVFGFGYAALMTLIFIGLAAKDPPAPTSMADPPPIIMPNASPATATNGPQPAITTVTAPAAPLTPATRFLDFAVDTQQLLDRITGVTVPLNDLRRKNPDLHARIKTRWDRSAKALAGSGTGAGLDPDTREAKFDAFADDIVTIVDDAYDRALRGPDTRLIVDHAQSYATQLRWAARGSMQECADRIAGVGNTGPLPRFAAYSRMLVGRALLGGPVDAVPKSARVRIPPDIFDAARTRADLSKTEFQGALLGEGAAAARCNARIALIDEATQDPDTARIDLLRQMFAR